MKRKTAAAKVAPPQTVISHNTVTVHATVTADTVAAVIALARATEQNAQAILRAAEALQPTEVTGIKVR